MDLDPLPILAELGIRETTRVTSITGGWDTALWRVESDGRSYALRIYRADQVGAWGREAGLMPALLDLGVPVPRVHAAAIARDRPALLLSWCDGGTLLRELRDRPWRVLQLGAAMGRMQAAIHSLPVTDAVARCLPAWTPQAANEPELEQQLLRRASLSAGAVLHLD